MAPFAHVILRKNYTLTYSLIVALLAGHSSASIINSENPNPTFTVIAMNTNGLGCHNQAKINSVSSLISDLEPDIVVISETKSHKLVANELRLTDSYSFHENPGVVSQCDNWKSVKSKWGILLGVHKRHTVAERLVMKLHEDLRGRVSAVDICIKKGNHQALYCRVVGVYAPYSYKAGPTFWNRVKDLCMQSKGSWIVAGDVNLSLDPFESKSPSDPEMISAYTRFLSMAEGYDLWINNDTKNCDSDWTYKRGYDPASKIGCSIIDRVAISRLGWIDGTISTVTSGRKIMATDHRPVKAILYPSVTTSGSNDNSPELFVPPKRLKQPKKGDVAPFDQFNATLDAQIERGEWGPSTVNNEDDFNRIYGVLTKSLTETSKDFFEVQSFRQFIRNTSITNATIRGIQRELKIIGGALYFMKDPLNARVSTEARALVNTLNTEPDLWKDDLAPLFFLKNSRKRLNKDLHREKSTELRARKTKSDKIKIHSTLRGGSSKRLYHEADKVMLPTVINPLVNSSTIEGDTNRLVCNPEEVKTEQLKYWKNLYVNEPDPEVPKPWLDSPSVSEIKKRTMAAPFLWPILLTIETFRSLLRKGNHSPAPGPDEWEKWLIKRLSSKPLEYIVALVNFIIVNCLFPGKSGDTWLAMIHKKGLTTLLTNWRGIMLSNFIANVPMAWLNFHLNPYLVKMGIIPESQIANHNGIQARDVISLLSSIACWARRNNTTVFMTKRDQMKGFDFLSPEGFHDAIRAYGLPSSIIDLDRASQANITCKARTAFGLTEPFIINGLTKQGGNLSPAKCVLTTSMLNWWLKDRSELDPDALTIRSHNHLAKNAHSPLDDVVQTIVLTEAMDDTILFSTNTNAMRRDVYASEHFLLAYSWRTSWEKSSISVFGPHEDVADTIVLQSVSPDNKEHPLSKTNHIVRVYKNEIEYLRTKVDDPRARALELKSIIQRFQFPRFIVKTPITVARKIIQQTLISQIRAKIALQPILTKDAEDLDRMISNKIHECQGFPYNPSPVLLHLPFDLNGFGFPSISRINSSIAAQGLERDLNHPVALYRRIAQITLADWQCQINDCEDPLMPNKTNHRKTENTRLLGKVPAQYLIGANALCALGLSLKTTDLQYVADGNISIRHIHNLAVSKGIHVIEPRSLTYLEKQGYRRVDDLGRWSIASIKYAKFDSNYFVESVRPSAAHINNRRKLTDWLSNLDLKKLFQIEDTDLLRSKADRQQRSESMIKALLDVRQRIENNLPVSRNQWGSDGSQSPAAAKSTEDRTTIATSIGRRRLTLHIEGNGCGILQGEVMGMIISTLDSIDSPEADLPICNTDHLFTVNMVKDHRISPTNVQKRLAFANARSYYRWLLDVVDRWTDDGIIRHVKGHTRDESIPAKLNRLADKEASSSVKISQRINRAPIPTFRMNDYTVFSSDLGWFEGNLRTLTEDLINEKWLDQFRETSYRLPGASHSNQRNPEHMYKTATSAYSATVQLYARSGQLPVRLLMATREDRRRKRPEIETRCPRIDCAFEFCQEVEGPIHLFYRCKGTIPIRLEYRDSLKETLSRNCTELNLGGAIEADLMRLCDGYFFDPSKKEINHAFYYLGIVPSLNSINDKLQEAGKSPKERKKIIFSIHAEIHNSGIRLTSRIWGMRTKKVLESLGDSRYFIRG